MTAGPDVSTEELRRVIVDGLQRTVDGLAGGYAAPLRSQLRAEGDVCEPAVLCLGLGRLCGAEEKTLPCALTLGLLEEMGRVFLGLEDGSTVSGLWGMPRTLNAADGLYALARQVLLTDEALDTESRLAALTVLTATVRDFSEALHAYAPEGHGALLRAARSLYPAAVSFAAVCCGFEDATRAALTKAAAAGSIETVFVNASKMTLREA
jgi:hypothetical protein